jgi:predicted dehydrogenase
MIDRILIVGLGSIGKRHLRLARELLPDAKIAVLRRKVESVIAEYADLSFSTMDDALAFAPQIAVIANPATFHLSVAMPLAKAGVHLLIEKPLSTSSEGINELIDTCKKKNAVLAMGYNLRFLPSLQKFKFLLDKNLIGTIWSVRSEVGQYLPSWRPDTDYRLGVSVQKELGGGVLLELSHEIDYLSWIFGEVNWVQAVLTRQSDFDINVEDSAHLILGFATDGEHNPLVATLNLDFIRQDTARSCTAIGKLGSLRWNSINGTVELWDAETAGWQEVYKYQGARDESYVAEWINFLTCVEQRVPPMSTGEDGLKVLHVIEAARLAGKTKSQIHVGVETECTD